MHLHQGTLTEKCNYKTNITEMFLCCIETLWVSQTKMFYCCPTVVITFEQLCLIFNAVQCLH